MDRLLIIFQKLKKKGFFHLIVSNYSIQFIVFGSHLLIAKIMAPANVGIIKTIETYTNMAIVLGGGGALFAVLKIIPSKKKRDIRSVTIRFSLKYVAVFSLCVFLLFNIMAYFGLISQDEETTHWFHIYSWIIIPMVLTQLLIRYYQAIDLFKRISTVVFYLKLASAAFVLFFTFYFFIKGYVLSMVLTTAFSVLVLLYDLRKELFVSTSEKYTALKKEILDLSKTAFFAQLIDQLKLNAGFFIANYVILDRVQFGHYAFALILIQGLNIISTSVQQFIIPKMSETSENLKLFFKKFRFFENKFILISIAIFIAAELLLPLLVTFVFGEKYDDAVLYLRIMLVGWFIQSFYTLKGVVFLSLGKMEYISYSSFLIFLIAAPAMYFLNLEYGALGAALSFILQHIIGLLLMSYFTRKVSRQNS